MGKLLTLIGSALVGYGIYKVVSGSKSDKIVQKAEKKVVETIKEIVELPKEIIKDKPKKTKKKSTSHKGHKTKKGLAQDQKLISEEKHEQSYQEKTEASSTEKEVIL